MSFRTALSLSFNNLMTKKGRTIMTAYAGSIGIIGIAAILALANGVNDFHAFDNRTEGRVCLVKVVVVDEVDKELAASRVRAGICHGDSAAVVFIVGHKLILDGVARSAATGAGRVAALDHKSVNYPVEDDTVIESFADEVGKIACSYGHVVAQFNDDVTKRCLQFYSCHEYKVYRNGNKYEHFFSHVRIC